MKSDELLENTMYILNESFSNDNSKHLSKYIQNHIHTPLKNSALRIYDAINFDIPELDKRVLSWALDYRFAGSTSTIPPFILDALHQERLNGKYPKVGTIKWFLNNPEAIKLYYDKYRGTNKLPYTSSTKFASKGDIEDKAKQLYTDSNFIKDIYKFNSNMEFNKEDIENYINTTNLPIIVQYGAFNKDYDITDKDKLLKLLNYYGGACDIEERDNCIFITFFDNNDLQ